MDYTQHRHKIDTMEVTDVIISGNNNYRSIEFAILGEPIAQNGWKIRWRGLRMPIMFDPLQRRKTIIKRLLTQALQELQEEAPFL